MVTFVISKSTIFLPMVRIFVSPSHLCTLYMILYARKTSKPGYKDVLVLDSPPKKKSLIELIKGTQKIYPWHNIIDLSTPLDDSVDLVANTKKALTRKLKSKPGIKQVYDFLLKRHTKKQRAAEALLLKEKLRDLGDVIEVNLLTQTLVNEALFDLFPKAQVNYFEHGSGDYYLIQKVKRSGMNFYCVFAEQFKKLLAEKGLDNSFVKQLAGYEDFPAIAQEVINTDPTRDEIIKSVTVKGKMVLIVLEAMQLYQVPDHYYTDYIDLCMKQLKDPQDYTFVLKPHPAQTKRSIEDQKSRLIDHYKVKTVVAESPHLVNFSIEVLFTLWKDNTEHFFGTYSSAIFYNSVLYKSSGTKFYFTYEFFLNYLQSAPQQFKDIYAGIKEPVKKVFSANCTSMT